MAGSPANSLNINAPGLVKFDGVNQFTGVTVTQHDVLIGGSSNNITSLTPGASGTVLTSNGVGADPSFQSASSSGAVTTITGNSGGPESPSSGNFNVLGTGSITVAGSTNTETVQLTGLTNHTVLVGASTDTITKVGPGNVGQVLQSGGASADPAYSTATYPSTAGTSGNVLTSDGTNWVSSAASGAGLQTISKNLTSAQIKSLHATPIEIVPAPGSGNIIQIVQAVGKFNYGGNNVFVAGVSQTIGVFYGTSLLSTVTNVIPNANLTGTTSGYNSSTASIFNFSASANLENKNIVLYNSVVTEISGNAANDNTVTINVLYRILTIV